MRKWLHILKKRTFAIVVKEIENTQTVSCGNIMISNYGCKRNKEMA